MQISRKTFDRLVEAAIESLPEEFAQWLDEVPVIVEDRPSAEDLATLEGADEPLGMYIGGSLADGDTSGAIPPRVMLYRLPLMEACDSRRQLAREIRRTLLHELGHHAGMDEDDLEAHGMGDMEDDIDWDVDE